MIVDLDMARVWRQFATRLAVALLAGAGAFLVMGLYFMQSQRSSADEVTRLRDEVSASDARTACRARIANAALSVEREANSLLRQALVDRYVSGTSDGLQDRAERMTALNRRVLDLTDLQTHAADICTQNPDFIPLS